MTYANFTKSVRLKVLFGFIGIYSYISSYKSDIIISGILFEELSLFYALHIILFHI